MPLTPILPDHAIQLAPNEVHVWCVCLDVPPGMSARLYRTLTDDERTRSRRFRFERDRRRFIVAHGALRDLMARYLQTRAARISYVYNAFGKPDLSPEFGGKLKFNLSHSAGLALIAVVADAEVGIDLERIRVESDFTDIAQRFFSAAEADCLNALPSHLRSQAFFSYWTKKEAYLKACGAGLSIPLDSFAVPLTSHSVQAPADFSAGSNAAGPAGRWSLHTLQPAPGYVGALAIEGTGWRLSQWPWKVSQDPSRHHEAV
jgi:4'-phosphopantetheinyl transferase